MNLYSDVIIAGFGGQGVMLIGDLLAQSAMNCGLEATYIPVYGPEMRGGTANCTVVVSDEEIGSPIVQNPLNLIIMNQPSLLKFQPAMADGGVLVLNSSLIDETLADARRVRLVAVPVNHLADQLGNVRMANMVAIGAYVQATGIMPLDRVKDTLPKVMYGRPKLVPKNLEAIQAGADYVARMA